MEETGSAINSKGCRYVFDEEGEQDLQHHIFERLSSLVHLGWLRAYCRMRDRDPHGTVEFRLENGLGQLASLQQPKTLAFHGCDKCIE